MLRFMPHARASKHFKLDSVRDETKASPCELYKEVEALKSTLTGKSLSDTDAWKTRQELCQLLESLLLIDLDYALDKKVEQDLWSFVFRNPIAACQSKAKEPKTSSNAYSKSQLSTLLETASGFYLQLLQKLCCAYDIELPCHPKDSVYGITKDWISRYPVNHQPRKSSLFYICQHCLVHLGDIARYRGQSLQAENFYHHAVDLVPSNGQPYNQLALLEAASGEKLSTVFFYMRSLSVQHPFPLAANNLQTLFSKMSTDMTSNEVKLKMTAFEYIAVFLQFQAAVHLHADIKKAEKLLVQLTPTLPALIIAEKFQTWQLVQMVAVCIFIINHSWSSGDFEKSVRFQEDALCPTELKATLLIEELLGGLLYAFLLPLHASPEPKETAVYYTLPAVKIILDWLLQHPKLLVLEPLNKKHQIWHALCKLLNDLESVSSDHFDSKKFHDIPLPEDWDLQCFLPLKESQRGLKFNLNAETPNDEESVWLRSVRLCKLGEQLSQTGKEGLNLLSLTDVNGQRHFKAINQVEPLPDKIFQHMQGLSVNSNSVALPPHSGISISEAGVIRSKIVTDGPPQQEVRFKLDDIQTRKEKFEAERDDKIDRRFNKDYLNPFIRVGRRVGKNVAMQAILQQHANQNPNILGRNLEFRKDSLDAAVRATNPSNRLENAVHIIANPETRTSQTLPEVNLNRNKVHVMQAEQYNSTQQQCSPQQSMDFNSSSDRESWIRSFSMHQSPISNQMNQVHNTVNTMGNYITNSIPHIMQQQPASDFPFHQNQSAAQSNHIVNKPVTNSQHTMLSNPSRNMMWNYMNLMASYQQACGGNLTPSPHPSVVMQQNGEQQQSNNQIQQQTNYYLMNPKIPTVDNTSVPSSILRPYHNNITDNDGILPRQSLDLFCDKISEPSSGHSISSSIWKDASHHSDVGSNQFSLNQVVGRAVGQNIQSNPSQIRENASSSTATTSNSVHELGSSTYSLFNSPWSTGLSAPRSNIDSNCQRTTPIGSERPAGSLFGRQRPSTVEAILPQSKVQSLWSGPGPSALEKLLEQQKQRRDNSAL